MPENRRGIAVDLFAGAGGLSLGFEQAGYDILAAVELDPVHAAIHEYNFPSTKMFCADVSAVSGEQLRQESLIADQDVDVVVGGAPCQGFSLIGKRSLQDPRNNLVVEFGRIVSELRPKHFVLENVSGLTVGKHRKFLTELMDFFEGCGYRVRRDYRVLQAAEFGVPQSRKRLFLIGARDDVELPAYPEPITSSRLMSGQPSNGFHPLCPSVQEALGDLPNADDYDELLDQDWVEAEYGEASPFAAVLRGIAEDSADYSAPRPLDKGVLTSSTRTVHTAKSIKRFSDTRPGTTEPVSRFLRLHPDGIANTLRAGTASDRGAYTSPRPIHPAQPRCITVREAARLHGYPDWFRFHTTKWHGFRQIGNSVPPPLARAVAAQLATSLDLQPEQGDALPAGDPVLLTMTQAQAAERFGVDRHVIPPRNRSK